VFEILCTAIVEGDIAPGSKISEPDLAKRLQVSRASLREAIGRLEACSLVSRKPNVGARVVELDSTQLLEIYHVREALEGMAARLAARHMSEAEIEQLRGLVEQHTRQFEEADGARHFQHVGDLDFHLLIVQGSHNGRLIKLFQNDLFHLLRMYRHQFGLNSQRTRPALAEHSYIVDVIASGDGEMAELTMRRHVRASRENLERMLQRNED
jgi:DNA-binding GntR family transcriptional regulator